ncbi:uncharacterized protein LOC132120908 [Carassius carassius]|uniref:uncharacterized protein LOC132120908 n=1 Tax=Carassius carassius TaxID=217509 RepID=UPI0028694E0D|nr:uncharacterized protein LOC132120908 [Carassius carassius]
MKSGGLARLIDKFDSVNIRMKKTDWSSEVCYDDKGSDVKSEDHISPVGLTDSDGECSEAPKPAVHPSPVGPTDSDGERGGTPKPAVHSSPVGPMDSDGERGDAPKPADHPSPVGPMDSDGERGDAPKPADHPSTVGPTDSDGERGDPPKPADHPSPVGPSDSDGERGDAPKPADHPSPVWLTDSDGERGDAPKPADHPSPVGPMDSDGERGDAPKPADHPSPVGPTDSDGERGDAPKPADHPSTVWPADSDGERGDPPKPADHPSPVGPTDSDGERGDAPKPADHPSPVGPSDSDGERGDAPKPADHPSPVWLTDSDGERGDAPKPAYHPSPVGPMDSDGERGDAPKPADHPSPVWLTDSDGERGDPPKPADHPSPVGPTDSDGERGDAPKPVDHPSPVGPTNSDGERGDAPKPAHHPSPVWLMDSDGDRGDAPKPAHRPSPVWLTDSDAERGDAPKPVDRPSPVWLTDSDGERGNAPKPVDRPSPVWLTDSDGERGNAPKPADRPSPVWLTDSDGKRGNAPNPADHPSPVGQTDSDGERGKAPKQQQNQKITYRATRPGPKCFKVYISARKWKIIRPLPGSRKLKTYEKFRKQNPCCTLVFTYQHLKVARSRKYRCPFMTVKASCSFESCNAHYVFRITQKPLSSDKRIPVTVTRIGKVTHSKGEVGSRPASYQKRGKIAKEVFKGVSNVYYRNLRKTPIPELMAGNISRSLSRNILKIISSEVRKSCRLHDDVILELMLTQKIIRDTDQSYKFCPGYVQHLQVDPFGVHLYTETGLVIFIQHLRKGCPVTLHLDATGGVVSRIPSQPKRVLYYSITLPGHGKDNPPLPISEMVTNDHTIPNVSFWLHQTVTKIRKLTTYNIHQVETDYSWALIQSVLLSFNKQDIHMYLMECYNLVKGNDTITDFSRQTVLHLCSAHIIKAVQGAIGKKTTDKGLKEFATHCVAQLINSKSLKRAVEIFKCMCHVFYTKQNTKCVNQCLKQLHDHISGIIIPEDTLDVKPPVDDYIPPEAKTILARSPFTKEFDSVLDTVMCNEDPEKETDIGNNKYHCPGILDFLMKDYMPIFPLWSGLMLGDLTRHKAKQSTDDDEVQKTHDTNCHAENWFCIVKDKILQKKLHHRPATFIQKMYASLQGRYREHILQHNLPDRILQKCFSVKKGGLEDSEEKWAKKSVCDRKGNKTKYFHTPDVIPSPKAKSSKPSVGHPKSSKKGDYVTIESKISQEAKASVPQQKSRNTKSHLVKRVSKTSHASEAKTKNKETDNVEVVSDTSQARLCQLLELSRA